MEWKLKGMTVRALTSVFNIPEIEDEPDYRRLYEKEKRVRVFYERKARELEDKLNAYMREHRHLLGRNKQDIADIIQDIRSFKSMLPNSVREIQPPPDELPPPQPSALIREFAVYGLTDHQLTHANPQQRM